MNLDESFGSGARGTWGSTTKWNEKRKIYDKRSPGRAERERTKQSMNLIHCKQPIKFMALNYDEDDDDDEDDESEWEGSVDGVQQRHAPRTQVDGFSLLFAAMRTQCACGNFVVRLFFCVVRFLILFARRWSERTHKNIEIYGDKPFVRGCGCVMEDGLDGISNKSDT